MQNYPIEIYHVKSRATDTSYFLAVPNADTDMVTNGLLLLASTQHTEIHLLYAADDEYELEPYAAARLRAERENISQHRTDLAGIGLDFEEFSRSPQVCEFAFHDVISAGYADAIKSVELDDFLKQGGCVVDRRAEFG